MKNLDVLMRDVARTVQADARRRQLLPEIQARLAALDGRPRAPEAKPWRWTIVGVAAAACGAAFALSLIQSPQPLSFAVAGAAAGRNGAVGDHLVASEDRPLAVRFSDGSEVTLPPQAKAQVEALDTKGATVAVEGGTVEVSVVHRAKTRWQVRAGRYRIHVTGTRFAAGWDPDRRALTVTMREGSVLVSGPGIAEPIPVVGGQRLRIRDENDGDAKNRNAVIEDARTPDVPAEVAPEAAAPSEGPSEAEASAPIEIPIEAELTRRAPGRDDRGARARRGAVAAPAPKLAQVDTSWRTLASRAQYKDALAAAVQGGWSRQIKELGAEDVVLLGDVARLAGDADRAEEAYRAARRRFPGADRPVFSLGRMAFENRHDYAAAAGWFESYVQLFPHGPLVREAAGRLLEARLKGGHSAEARQAAASYLRTFPNGPHAALARRTVGQ